MENRDKRIKFEHQFANFSGMEIQFPHGQYAQEFGFQGRQNKMDFSAILNGLKNDDEAYDSAIQLSEYLSYSNADNLAHGSTFAYHLPQFLDSFAHILSTTNNHELSLVVIQCLNNLLDALPVVAKLFRSNGLMSAICQKFTPEEFDLFEDLINIMHKVSQERPEGLFESGVLTAILSCDLNFFEKSLLTKVSTIASNICKHLPPDAFRVILPVMDKISELIHHQDSVIREKALLCFHSIALFFVANNKIKEFLMLLSEDLVQGIVDSLQDNNISNTQENCSIKTLGFVCISPQYLKFLMTSDLCNYLAILLHKNTPDTLKNVIHLIGNMTPSIPKEMDIFQSQQSSKEKIDLFKQEPNLLLKLASSGLLNSLIDLFGRTNTLKLSVLECITKIIYYSTNEILLLLLEKSTLFNVISQLFTSNDKIYNATGISLVKICMEKQPDFCKDFFIRNGVVEKLNKMSPIINIEEIKDDVEMKSVHFHRHPLKQKPATDNEYKKGFCCDECDGSYSKGTRWNCAECKYDICNPCLLTADSESDDDKTTKTRYPLRSRSSSSVNPAPTKKRNVKENANTKQLNEPTLEPVMKKRKKEKKIILSPHELLLQNSSQISNQFFSGIQLETSEYKKLISIVKSLGNGSEIEKENALKELFLILESISSYECAKSGIPGALNSYFFMNHVIIDHQVLKQRLSTFISVFFGASHEPPLKLRALIYLLKQLLEEEEGLSWPVFISPYSAPQIIQNLVQTRQIRIKIVKDNSIKGVWDGIQEKEYDVEPLTTIGRIKDQIINTNRIQSANSNNNLSANQPNNQLNANRKQPVLRRELVMDYVSDDDDDIDDDDRINLDDHIFRRQRDDDEDDEDDDDEDDEDEILNDMQVLDDLVARNLSTTQLSAMSNPNSTSLPQGQLICLSYNGVILDDDVTLVSAIQNGASQNTEISISAWRQKHQFTLHSIEKKNEKKDDIIDSPVSAVACTLLQKEASSSVFLNLLWLVDALYNAHANECNDVLKNDVFISSKIASKVAQQLQDHNSICCLSFPYWCKDIIQNYQFLISLDARIDYFRHTSFGLLRSLHQIAPEIQVHGYGQGNHVRHVRIPKQKVKIHRDRLFESSFQVLEICAAKKHFLLDVEYFGEVGTGLGPTKEFYTLLSYQFQMVSKAMFLSGEDGDTLDVRNDELLVHNQSGLYPKPLLVGDTRNRQTLLKNYHCLGQFMAKAMLDDRYLDMKFSRVFYKLLLNEKMTLYDLKELSPSFGSVILKFHQIVLQKNAILKDKSKTEAQKKKEISQLKYEGGSIENLDLNFTIAEGILKEGGDDCYLSIDNIEEYVRLVYDAFFGLGVECLIQSFKEGFTKFFPIENLKCFAPEELDAVVCGVSEAKYWAKAELSTMPFELANGFNSKSTAILLLIDILAELSHENQRKFLTFLTGSPRLPIGGFKNLKPLIKISRKESNEKSSNGHFNPDDELPSANTCFNHLKLPNYSEFGIMKAKIIFAIENARGFELS